MTEPQLRALAERAFNPLVPMPPDLRTDLQELLKYAGALRQTVQTMHEEVIGIRQTLMVICRRQPDSTIKVPFAEALSITEHDRLFCEDVDEAGEPVKVFRFVPEPRVQLQ